MVATIGMQLRLPIEEYEALEKLAPRGKKTELIRRLLRRELQRRGMLPPEKPAGRK